MAAAVRAASHLRFAPFEDTTLLTLLLFLFLFLVAELLF